MKAGNRRCSNCRKKCSSENILSSSLRAFCSMECLMSFTRSEKGKKVVKKAIESEYRQKKANVREKHKTRSQWLAEAQSAFNKYVRWRDRDEPCISCGSFPDDKYGGNFDAGHFRSRGSAPHLSYCLWNVHKQCVKCNRFRSGAVNEYRAALIQKIGKTKVEYIETTQSGPERDIKYAQRVKSIFTRLLKHRRKQNGEL